MSVIERSRASAAPGAVVAEGSGIDPTGKTDSTVGLENSWQKAINKRKTWYIPGGHYLIGERGTGLDAKALTWTKLIENFSPVTIYGGAVEVSGSATFFGHHALKKEPIFNFQPPAGKQLLGFTVLLDGRFTGAWRSVAGCEVEAASKIIKKISETASTAFYVGAAVAGTSFKAGTTITSIISETEVEVSNAWEGAGKVEETVEFGTRETTAVRLNQTVDSVFTIGLTQYCQTVLLLKSNETDTFFTANNNFYGSSTGSNEKSIVLESGKEGTGVGVQANTFHFGDLNTQVIAVEIDKEVKQNSRWNTFFIGTIDNSNKGILDNTGLCQFYVGVITSTGEEYVIPAKAVGSGFFRGYMETNAPFATTLGAIEAISTKNPLGQAGTFIPAVPKGTGNTIRNVTARSVGMYAKLGPRNFKPTAGTAIAGTKFALTGAKGKGFINDKQVYWNTVSIGVTTPKQGGYYYVVGEAENEFELAETPGGAAIAVAGAELKTDSELWGILVCYQLTAETAIASKIFNMTGCKAKGLVNGRAVSVRRISPGCTNPKLGSTGQVYWVNDEEENSFKLVKAFSEVGKAGAGIEVLGHAVEPLNTEFETQILSVQGHAQISEATTMPELPIPGAEGEGTFYARLSANEVFTLGAYQGTATAIRGIVEQ